MPYTLEGKKIAIIGKDYGYTKGLVEEFSRINVTPFTIPRNPKLGTAYYIDTLASKLAHLHFDAVITGVKNSNLESELDKSGFFLACELTKLGIPVLVVSTQFHKTKALELGYGFADVSEDFEVLLNVLYSLLHLPE